MNRTWLGRLVTIAGLSALAGSASAANTTVGTAIVYGSDQGWVQTTLGTTAGVDNQRWYRVEVQPGSSYCVETALGDFVNNETDTIMTVYSNSTLTTQLASNDDYFYASFSRACFYATTAAAALVQIEPFSTPTPARNVRFRMIETTVTAPWWFVAANAGYNAYAEISNSTNLAVVITAAILNAAGATIGTTTRTIAAKGNVLLSVASDFGVSVTNGTGSVQVGHNGPPGAIQLNVTSLSAVQGLSFDSPGVRRN